MKKKRSGVQIAAPAIPVSIEFILDETGSMSRCKNATIGGFNDFLNEQRTVPGECQMTLTKFEGGRILTPYEDLSLNYVPELTTTSFNPAGGTNLYDAIIARMQARKAALTQWNVEPKVLLVVMTDGEDNISSNGIATVRSMIEFVTAEGWTCVYLGADQNALRIGQSMGFQSGNIKSFASAEMQQTMQTLSAATTVYRSAATTSGSNFF